MNKIYNPSLKKYSDIIPLMETLPRGIENNLPGILFITSFPPRECGIATYSQDLIKALDNKFSHSFRISICPVESHHEKHIYTNKVKYRLNCDEPDSFSLLAKRINADVNIRVIMVQHEFGFFEKVEKEFRIFLRALAKPVVIVFHTVLPRPDEVLGQKVLYLANVSHSIVVMTNAAAKILIRDYGVTEAKITVIPHGTHLVPHRDKVMLKEKYNLTGKKVLTTFGLLNPGKSIETTLEAMPAIIKAAPDTIFLIVGKTHPAVVKQDGYKYHNMLDAIVRKLGIQDHVRYINYYLPLPELLEYLQLTDIYLFTSKDPNQVVSGTFAYALSCGCPIISTPIPHALEVLRDDIGIIVDFENPEQLTEAVTRLLNDEPLMNNISNGGLHLMAPTAWENTAISHALLFEKIIGCHVSLNYRTPPVNLDHVKNMTTGFGIIQFSRINQPDIDSGYTLDDNARALIAMCQHFKLTKDNSVLKYIQIYYNFIEHCLQPEGYFLNYVNEKGKFTEQNYSTNLADSNGRAIWALGYLVSISRLLPEASRPIANNARATMQKALLNVNNIHSTRAMAFVIKGLYYRNVEEQSIHDTSLIKQLADKLVQMFRHESEKEWLWYESYLTYANSILPEAMLCAWMATCEPVYKEIARSSFDFLLSKTFNEKSIRVISNKGWLQKGNKQDTLPAGGEQPIDVAYTILALHKFHGVFNDAGYLDKMKIAFNWFLGNNHLNQVIYNPCTGGCYDGAEEKDINLNQGAESTISYLMARLTIEKASAKEDKKRILKAQYYKSAIPELQ